MSGTPANGTFDGTVFLNQTGCTASRHYTGPVSNTSINWGNQGDIATCPGASQWPFTSVTATAK